MDKKARSKPMRYILDRMLAYGDFEVVIFGDKTIIDEGMTIHESNGIIIHVQIVCFLQRSRIGLAAIFYYVSFRRDFHLTRPSSM